MQPISAKDIKQAISLMESGLSFRMDQVAREFAEDALWLLKNDRFDAAVDELCQAAAMCSEPISSKYLVEARDLLAPDRITSS